MLDTIAWEFHQRLIVLVIGRASPTVREWDRFVAECAARAADDLNGGVLVVSDGGAPSSTQRHAIANLSAARQTPQAVVVNSAVGRGVVTAMSWLGIRNKPFAPRELMEAFAFVGGAELGVDFATLQAAVRRLERQLEKRIGA